MTKVLICGSNGPALVFLYRLVRHVLEGGRTDGSVASPDDDVHLPARDALIALYEGTPAINLTLSGLASRMRVLHQRPQDVASYLDSHRTIVCTTPLDRLPSALLDRFSHILCLGQNPESLLAVNEQADAMLEKRSPRQVLDMDSFSTRLDTQWYQPMLGALTLAARRSVLYVPWNALIEDGAMDFVRWLALGLGSSMPEGLDRDSLAGILGLHSQLGHLLHPVHLMEMTWKQKALLDARLEAITSKMLLDAVQDHSSGQLSLSVDPRLKNQAAPPAAQQLACVYRNCTLNMEEVQSEARAKKQCTDSVNIVWIPARSGSSRLRDKNIADLGGLPLMAYAILPALRLRGVHRVIVDTDSERYADMARDLGAEAFLRPPHLATDTATITGAAMHCLSRLNDQGTRVGAFIHLYPTSPFRQLSRLQAMVDALEEHERVRTALRLDILPDRLMHGESGQMLSPSLDRRLATSLPFKYTGHFHGLNHFSDTNAKQLVFLTHPLECLDIDTREDLDAARWALANLEYDFGWRA